MKNISLASAYTFRDMYYSNRKKDNNISFEEAYEKTMQYFDETRKKVNLLKSMRDIVLYSFLYNISSSLNSIIKNHLLGLVSLSTPLMIRNIIESIIVYKNIFMNLNSDRYIEGYFLSHFFFEEQFSKLYFEQAQEKTLNREFITSIENAIERLSKIYSINDKALVKKLFSKRMGWTYGMLKNNSYSSMSILIKNIDDDYISKMYFDLNLNKVVHLHDFTFDINLIDLNIFITFALKIFKEIDSRVEIKVEKKTMKQLRTEYSKAIFETHFKKKYTGIAKQLGKENWYEYEIKKINRKDELKDLFKGETRFEFECIAYAGGYSPTFNHYSMILLYIKYIITQFGNNDSKKHIDTYIDLLTDMESDIAFGFHNEYKIKFRYFVDFSIYFFLGIKTQNKFEKFVSESLTKTGFGEKYKIFSMSLYNESCNFVHPNIYGYWGHYSQQVMNIWEYHQVADSIIFSMVEVHLKRFPYSISTYNSLRELLYEIVGEYNRVSSIFNKYSFTI
ncbi:MAG: hypothetical protein JEZ05_03040 [Tenericutes bacterium]|nr:hypothetical protein [Mycoplasmatota bacterium]